MSDSPLTNKNRKGAMTYREAGVDINAGADLVERIKPMAAATKRAGVMGGLGGFGALFDTKAAGFVDPVLVSGTDGVGTKLMLAFETGRHDTIGIDLVAMCVNDVLCQGAQPLFFLDYFATGTLDAAIAADVVSGIARGCELAGCALVGGETAEMPDMYAPGHYDLAGFTVGAVERENILPRQDKMAAGDVLIALPSSGPHSNGYSLIRKIVERSGLALDASAPFANASLGEALLTPTRIYARTLAPLLASGRIKGLSHITGGGLTENLPRMCPDTLVPSLDHDALPSMPVFNWLADVGHVAHDEMARTFNMGVGMVLCASQGDANAMMKALSDAGEVCFICGELTDA